MTDEQLPSFRYHPDVVASGSVVPSENTCVCCEQARGYIYTGPVYAETDHVDDICPWCIADGSAHDQLDAEFVDQAAVGDFGTWDDVPTSVSEEVAYRTPGFTGWQTERWFTCCGDAAAFIGRAGHKELLTFGQTLIESLREELGWDGEEWAEYFRALSKDDQPTAYVFRCLHCQKLGGYSDFT
jgi:uncharacterized protein CbrC (UPF0167 family)